MCPQTPAGAAVRAPGPSVWMALGRGFQSRSNRRRKAFARLFLVCVANRWRDHLTGTIMMRAAMGAITTKRLRSCSLGSRLIDFHSQNKTVAASMMAEKKVSGHRSYRVATRRQSFRRPNMISMRLRRL